MLKPECMAPKAQHLPCCASAQVWELVSPRLADKPKVLEWLRANTRPLAEQQTAGSSSGGAAPAAAAAEDKVLVGNNA